MKPLRPTFVTAALVLAACAPSRTPSTSPEPAPAETPRPAAPTPTPAPTPAPTPPAPAPTPAAPAAPVVVESPRNWQLLAESTDRVAGIGSERAMKELLAGRQPERTVLVAVIDGGVDTAHVDLKANLWTNPKEIAGNGKDDDGNGYVDDIHGWNFIGGADGRDVHQDTFELTRLYVRCTPSAAGTSTPVRKSVDTLTTAERQRCPAIAAEYEKKKSETQQTAQQVTMIGSALTRAVEILQGALGKDSVTTAAVSALESSRPDVQQAKRVFLQLAANGITPKDVTDARKQLDSQINYGLNPSFDPRPIVGDDYANVTQRHYGNGDVMGPDAKHGTHVAGIIGAVRGNGVGIDGIAPAVKIMMVRTVPDGDERDKDVANAIRYAVDNGAQVINMSFGKSYSPAKPAVDAAAKYADSKGVLMIHAAGNDGEDIGKSPSFPTPVYDGGGRAQNWIEVGASSWKSADSLAASFSNFSQTQVDVFAPGVDILSTIPGGDYERDSGTSMAAPVVTGLAALLMSYYPNLTAADVKRIILASAARHTEQLVIPPGGGAKVKFGTLSATGAIVDAYAAIKMAGTKQ
jgi:subtilisin family serine protease